MRDRRRGVLDRHVPAGANGSAVAQPVPSDLRHRPQRERPGEGTRRHVPRQHRPRRLPRTPAALLHQGGRCGTRSARPSARCASSPATTSRATRRTLASTSSVAATSSSTWSPALQESGVRDISLCAPARGLPRHWTGGDRRRCPAAVLNRRREAQDLLAESRRRAASLPLRAARARPGTDGCR